jgi:hypothetical protein
MSSAGARALLATGCDDMLNRHVLDVIDITYACEPRHIRGASLAPTTLVDAPSKPVGTEVAAPFW